MHTLSQRYTQDPYLIKIPMLPARFSALLGATLQTTTVSHHLKVAESDSIIAQVDYEIKPKYRFDCSRL